MARIRTIKPEFWTDERVGECSVSARLLFVATWNFADDHGGLDRSAKQLKAQAFPYDNIDCEPLVQELLQAGLLVEYESGGKKYLHIRGFRAHQKVEKPAKPRVPLYEPSLNTPRVLLESSPSSSGNSPVSSGLFSGRESKGREGTSLRERPPDSQSDREPESRAEFERLRSAYPQGIYARCDWLIAEREARRRIDEGHTWDELIAGAKRYAAQCEAKGNIGTQFVESPKKFFTLPECKFRDPFPLPANPRKSNPEDTGWRPTA